MASLLEETEQRVTDLIETWCPTGKGAEKQNVRLMRAFLGMAAYIDGIQDLMNGEDVCRLCYEVPFPESVTTAGDADRPDEAGQERDDG